MKGQKRQFFLHFFTIFSAVFPNIWPLAGPNIAKKGGSLQKLARGDRQTHFGTFNFWLKPGSLYKKAKTVIFLSFFNYFFDDFSYVFEQFISIFHPSSQGPRPGPGGPGPGLGWGLRRRMENVVFSARVFQAVIKSAASAASLDLQGSPRRTAQLADNGYG